MRRVSPAMTAAWKARAKTGPQRPVVRATVQIPRVMTHDYDTAWANGGTFETDRHRVGTFSSLIFGSPQGLREIRNIKSCTWTRSVEQDTATCELTFENVEISPIGNADEQSTTGELDQPGIMMFNRGHPRIGLDRWGYHLNPQTGWRDVFVPDRIVRTYEGYGEDPTKEPADDPNLMPSGVWMIETVTYNHNGTITLTMKDMVSTLLMKQIVFPPAIPYAEYPLSWSRMRTENVPGRDVAGGHWEENPRTLGTATSSNSYYIGMGIQDPPFGPYVTSTGSWNGHHPNHALTADRYQNWVSTGQVSPDSTVWWQFDMHASHPVSGIRLRTTWGPYRVFVSVHDGTKWLGTKKIPYKVTSFGVDVEADIPYVASAIPDRGNFQDIVLHHVYPNVKKIRLTFTRLHDINMGQYEYRAAIANFGFYTGDPDDMRFEPGEHLKVVGNYIDYTDIVKWICAWAGWYWPPESSGQDFIRTRQAAPEREYYHYVSRDNRLPVEGRVWGSFHNSYTAGIADLTVDMFDKKPLMDVINYVRDLLGFNFYVDELGGVIWRLPNMWKQGNYEQPTSLKGDASQLLPGLEVGLTRDVHRHMPFIHTLDEEETLLSYSTMFSSEDVRDYIFVGNVVGKIGTTIKGFNPYRIGLRRTAGWTDQNFATVEETRVMADMIAARQMFTYRRAKAQIPGYPAIQIDDQVRIIERMTNETYYHYVVGISSSLDMESGVWTYDLDTHWLGEKPEDAWVVKVTDLAHMTRAFLNALDP